MKPFFTSLAAVAIATAPIAASAVSISNIDGPNDYHSVNLSQTTHVASARQLDCRADDAFG